ncbi:MAG: hypothetical protein K6C99_05950 [Lachnospiraceae bacterium]|nr:hypothetical protein [Lachnospiraceae bacterium]
MRNKYRSILMFGLVLSCLILTACTGNKSGRSKTEEVVNLYCDSWIVDNYMNAVSDYDHVIYECYYYDHGRLSIGPTERGFRGIVYLTEEEAKRLEEEYEWEDADISDTGFEQIESDFTGDGPWYVSKAFNEDNYSAVNILYTYFDGKKLVFNIHQT